MDPRAPLLARSLVSCFIVLIAVGCRPTDNSVPREQWSFSSFELREASKQPFPGALRESWKATEYYVAPEPFLITRNIKSVSCINDGTTTVFFDREGDAAFTAATERLAKEGGYLAMYFDGKVNVVVKVKETIRGGNTQVMVPCKKGGSPVVVQ